MSGRSLLFVLSLLSMIGATPVFASTVVSVSATDDLYAAGLAAGRNCCAGDSTPANSPILAPLTFVTGEYLTFTATGGASHAPAQPVSPTADGDTSFTYNLTADYGTGISGPRNVYLNGLAGVFLSDAGPTSTAPAQLSGTAFSSIAPGLNQIFFIGDGLTGTGSGSTQTFYVPTGATRLYLGIIDDGGYYDNFGTITATINAVLPGPVAPAGVPEPTSIALLGIGFLGVVASRRRGKA